MISLLLGSWDEKLKIYSTWQIYCSSTKQHLRNISSSKGCNVKSSWKDSVCLLREWADFDLPAEMFLKWHRRVCPTYKKLIIRKQCSSQVIFLKRFPKPDHSGFHINDCTLQYPPLLKPLLLHSHTVQINFSLNWKLAATDVILTSFVANTIRLSQHQPILCLKGTAVKMFGDVKQTFLLENDRIKQVQ